MYEELVRDLDNLRKRTARFRRIALHLHSIDSHDWGKTQMADRSRNARTQFEGESGRTLFIEQLKPHLDLLSVTDHMKCGYAVSLSDSSIRSPDEFVVLPGMEVNFRLEAALGFARVHLLVIFPEGSSTEVFGRLFEGQIAIPDDIQRTGNEEVAGISLYEWVKRVHDNGGICIAAHVDNDQGVRCRFRQTAIDTLKLFSDADKQALERENLVGDHLKQYLFDSRIDAIEIHRSSDAPHYRWVDKRDGKNRYITTVLTFDAHCVEQFNRSSRVTYAKMTHLGMQGLRDAILFPDTRIRFPENLPTPPSPTIRGLRIDGGEASFFEKITIAFAENLNCIIGTRGAGKSTVVEALRYVFGYNRTLKEIESLQQPIRDLQRRNLRDCLIRVVYQDSSGEEKILSATFDEKSDYSTKVHTSDGTYIEVADVEGSGDFPLRLFGWSEVETLGRSSQKQRDLLDRLVPNLPSALSRRKELRDQIAVNRRRVDHCIEELRVVYESREGEIRRYKEFRDDFEKINLPEVKDLFASLDLMKEKREVLLQVFENSKSLHVDLNSDHRKWLQHGIGVILEKGDEELTRWWREEEAAALGLVEREAEIRDHVSIAEKLTMEFSDLVTQHGSNVKRMIETISEDLQRKVARDSSLQKIADLRANADKRLRRVSKLRADYLDKFMKLEAVIEERREFCDMLHNSQREIADIRARNNSDIEAVLNSFLPKEMRVNIALKRGGDTEVFGRWLHGVFGARSNQSKRIRRVIEERISPMQLARIIEDGRFGELLEGVEGDQCLEPEDVDVCVNKTKVYEHDHAADVVVARSDGEMLGGLLELQEINWDDDEKILLNGVPVNEKSPGQRSSAMLPLIALAEKTPLVIDQPEDNLDKRLIGSVLSKVLAELKEQRQIIVCTHDPNILVGGDAEQVVVFEAESDKKGKVVNHGSIDNMDIVGTVVDLLEGGAEAFRRRQKRYAERGS